LEGAPSTQPAVLSGTISDPGTLDSHTVNINWGDGSSTTTLAIAAGTLSFSGVTHSFPSIGSGQPGSSSGIYSVTVTVTDKDGASSTSTVSAHVSNVPPTLSNLYIPPANEGQSDTLSGTIYDAGPLDSFIMKIDWGEGSLFPQTQDFAAGTTDFYVSHAFADNGTYTVNVQLRDNHMQGPGSSPVEASTTATIANVAPTLTDVSATTINENGTTSVTGYINDPGIEDTFTMAVDWGDPRSPNDQQNITFPASATGQQPFTLTHQYLDNPQTGSQYTVALNITDKDGGTSQTNTAVTVNNVAPSNVSIAFSPSTIDGYGTGTLNGSFTDPGSLDTHTVVVDWGDGSAPTTLPPLAAGVFDL
jgi:hypothetical protein